MYIPKVDIRSSSSHPWLNSDCLQAIDYKMSMAGSPDLPFAVRACSRTLLHVSGSLFHAPVLNCNLNEPAQRVGGICLGR